MRQDRKERKEVEQPEFEERVVTINRVTKVVKGGRRFRFAALVVIGDKKGNVGFGTGKSQEVPEAIKKAVENAKKNMITISTVKTTIPHEVTGVYGAGRVILRPASEGTGVIAGGPARSVCELAGIKNIRTKALGSTNKQNVVMATIKGLSQIMTPEEVAAKRGKSVAEIIA